MASFINQNADVAWRKIAGEAVLVQARQRQIIIFNEVGSRIWELCDGRHTLGDIINTLAQEFLVSRRELATDVGSFLKELFQRDLVYCVEENK